MKHNTLRSNPQRLQARLAELATIGAIHDGGVCRLALSEEDRLARDQVVAWMRELGLQVTIDAIGNIIGLRPGRRDGPPVMTGSHIDTVATGGRYDGSLGVLAGLEVVATLNDHNITTEHPLAVACFTNEEGSRFAPDMLGSLVYVGGLSVADARAISGIDGAQVGECLDAIGYAGTADCGHPAVRAFVELHIEQGPLLEQQGMTIGAVEQVQGISWMEYQITGVSNHAGTTPMALRHDAGYAAAALACEVRRLARAMGDHQVGTVGALTLTPNLVNVVAEQARLTVDLRNTDESLLQQAETELAAFVQRLAIAEGVTIESRRLARFEPVDFAPAVIQRVETTAQTLGYSVRRMPSGAGHDAQMLARVCPTAMIFVPSVGGISHNIKEFTRAEDVQAGADVLLNVVVDLAMASTKSLANPLSIG